MQARHTRILETTETSFGTLVREDYFGYPASESNLYLVDASGTVIWFAERAMPADAYANSVRVSEPSIVACASWNGFDCEINLKNGQLLGSRFTR